MKWKILSLALCAALFSTALCTGVQATGMAEFQKQRTYSGQFQDITGKWHESYIADLYEYGLAEGMDEKSMAPDDPVTVAQVIALAARINAKYYDGKIGAAGDGQWYKPYIKYAFDYGVIDRSKPFDDADAGRPATRGESLVIFSRALPDWQLDAVNDAKTFDDVPGDAECSAALTLMYRAGVVSGYEDGLFHPDGTISRAEVMTIADRMVNKSQRRGYNEAFSGSGDNNAKPGDNAGNNSGTANNKWTAKEASGTFVAEGIAMINADLEKGSFMMAVTDAPSGGMVTLSGVCETKMDLRGNIVITCVVKDRAAQGGVSVSAALQAESVSTFAFYYDGYKTLTLREAVFDGELINGDAENVIGLMSIGMTLSVAG